MSQKPKKSSPSRTPQEREDWRARLIQEGRLRPGKPMDWDEWDRLPKFDISPEVAAHIIKDLIDNR